LRNAQASIRNGSRAHPVKNNTYASVAALVQSVTYERRAPDRGIGAAIGGEIATRRRDHSTVQ
jgi:hypothetical protein